jgi:hypothetical protein
MKSLLATVQDAAKLVESACAALRGKGMDKAAHALSLGTVVLLGGAFDLKYVCCSMSDTYGSKASDGILELTRNVNTRESHRTGRSACP